MKYKWFQLCNYSDGRRGFVFTTKRGWFEDDLTDEAIEAKGAED